MASGKYTDDSTVSSLAGTEKIPVTQSGMDMNFTPNLLANFLNTLFKIVKTGTVIEGTWNAKFLPRINSISTAATITPDYNSYDATVLKNLTVAVALNTPVNFTENFQRYFVRITPVGANRNISFSSDYRFTAAITAPTSITLGTTLYLEFVYNREDLKLDCVYKDVF